MTRIQPEDHPGQDDTRTPAYYRKRAADIRAVGRIAEATAEAAQSAFDDLGGVGEDFGQRVALRLRECAREAAWTATQIDVYAVEAAEREVGRLDSERPPNFSVVRGGAA